MMRFRTEISCVCPNAVGNPLHFFYWYRDWYQHIAKLLCKESEGCYSTQAAIGRLQSAQTTEQGLSEFDPTTLVLKNLGARQNRLHSPRGMSFPAHVPKRCLSTDPTTISRIQQLRDAVKPLEQEVQPMLDEQLVQQIQQGQKQAFASLLGKWQHPIYSFCLRQLGEQALAEEATQDIFVNVYKNIHSFRGEAKFSTWLYRIATNHCINLRGRFQRRHRDQHQSIDEGFEHTSSETSPDDLLQQQDDQLQIQQALLALGEEQRMLLILRDIQDHSYEEISLITNLPIGTIKSRIHRGRTQLRQILEQSFNIKDGNHE